MVKLCGKPRTDVECQSRVHFKRIRVVLTSCQSLGARQTRQRWNLGNNVDEAHWASLVTTDESSQRRDVCIEGLVTAVGQ